MFTGPMKLSCYSHNISDVHENLLSSGRTFKNRLPSYNTTSYCRAVLSQTQFKHISVIGINDMQGKSCNQYHL